MFRFWKCHNENFISNYESIYSLSLVRRMKKIQFSIAWNLIEKIIPHRRCLAVALYNVYTKHEQKRMELDVKAGRKANTLSWVGLGLMSVQFGVLARLTWFEYSWDVSLLSFELNILFQYYIPIFSFRIDHGTSHILCYVRYCYGSICLLCAHKTGMNFVAYIWLEIYWFSFRNMYFPMSRIDNICLRFIELRKKLDLI